MEYNDINKELIKKVTEMIEDEVLNVMDNENLEIQNIVSKWHYEMYFDNNTKSLEELKKYPQEWVNSLRHQYDELGYLTDINKNDVMLADLYYWVAIQIISHNKVYKFNTKVGLVEKLREIRQGEMYIDWNQYLGYESIVSEIEGNDWKYDIDDNYYKIIETLVDGANGQYCPKLVCEYLGLPEIKPGESYWDDWNYTIEPHINASLQQWFDLHTDDKYASNISIYICNNENYGDVEVRIGKY